MCYAFHVGRGPANHRKGEKGMDEGMNAHELQELKAALLKVERLEVLLILRDVKTLEEAISALEQRVKA